MDRTIGDTEHPSIRDASQLHVWFHKEQMFKLLSCRNFPKSSRPGSCKVCAQSINKSTGKPYHCTRTCKTWESFKYHLRHAENILGELIAFPTSVQVLPPKSNYIKHRKYGNLHHYQQRESFYIFDIQKNEFVQIYRANLGKQYSNRKQRCTYCPCAYKIKSPTNILKHLQVIETRFYCFLVLDKLDQNDKRNMSRIQKFVSSINSKASIEDDVEVESIDENIDEILLDDTHKSPKSYDYEETNNFEDEDKNVILTNFENDYHKSFETMNGFFEKLKDKLCSTNLNQGIIDAQEQLKMIKRIEDFQEKEKEFTFMREINLNYEDLDYLMNKYGISNEYEIDKSNVTLVIQVKEIDSSPQEVQSIDNKSYNANNSYHNQNYRLSDRKFEDDSEIEETDNCVNLYQVDNQNNYLEIDDENDEILQKNVQIDSRNDQDRTNASIRNDHYYQNTQFLSEDSEETMDCVEQIMENQIRALEKSNEEAEKEINENNIQENRIQFFDNNDKTPSESMVDLVLPTNERPNEHKLVPMSIIKNIFKIKKERDLDEDTFDLMNCKKIKKS